MILSSGIHYYNGIFYGLCGQSDSVLHDHEENITEWLIILYEILILYDWLRYYIIT